MTQQGRNFVNGYNYYVPAMQAAADLGQLLDDRVNFGKPALADAAAANVVTGVSEATATTVVAAVADAPFGRSVAVKASAASGANLTLTIVGRDYLGQPMRENIVIANADGTNNVLGLKAFKYIDKVLSDGGASAAITFGVGWSTKLGLPYVTRAVEREYSDQVVAAAGTLVAGALTDPQTATSGDPRGTYIPTTTLDGIKTIEADVQYSNYVNANNRGGLHGVPHFAG